MLKVITFLTLCILLCIPGVASANAGVPMIFLAMPALGLSIIPIIIIEAMFLSKKLELTTSSAFKTTTISNLVSTIVGIPLTWLLLVLIQMMAGGGGAFGLDTTLGKVLSVTLQAAWLIPYESDLHWMIPVAGLVLLVPFFFVSWWSEYFVSRKMLQEQPAQRVKIAVRNANIITYALLAFWPIGFWVLNSATNQ
ncbi:MAG: hypothetical protein D3921_06585 [Candidatus Electrothrix sp. AW1]|nr:hypothetical protein [Candidatus Electrothrix sp. AX1]MCI5182167.1 hypothetical protein [Candidatus Electrothrix gigas]